MSFVPSAPPQGRAAGATGGAARGSMTTITTITTRLRGASG